MFASVKVNSTLASLINRVYEVLCVVCFFKAKEFSDSIQWDNQKVFQKESNNRLRKMLYIGYIVIARFYLRNTKNIYQSSNRY